MEMLIAILTVLVLVLQIVWVSYRLYTKLKRTDK